MKLVFVLLATFPAVAYAFISGSISTGAANTGAMAAIAPFIPAECKQQIDEVMKKADEVYEWLKNEKCKECPDGVKFSALVLKEELAKHCIDAYIDWLATQGFDIDTICMEKFRRSELWPYYDQFRADCIMKFGEVENHPDFCKAKDEDFPKTGQCCKDKGNQIFASKAVPPPMECVNKALEKCNSEHLGKWTDHFFRQMREDIKIHENLNGWVIGNQFFATKCTGNF